jgi:hypothetical protein
MPPTPRNQPPPSGNSKAAVGIVGFLVGLGLGGMMVFAALGLLVVLGFAMAFQAISDYDPDEYEGYEEPDWGEERVEVGATSSRRSA